MEGRELSAREGSPRPRRVPPGAQLGLGAWPGGAGAGRGRGAGLTDRRPSWRSPSPCPLPSPSRLPAPLPGAELARSGPKGRPEAADGAEAARADPSGPERSRSRPRRRRGSSSRTGRAPRRWPPPPRCRGPGTHREAARAPAPGTNRELPTPAEPVRGRRPRARRWPSGSRSAPLAAGPRGRARRHWGRGQRASEGAGGGRTGCRDRGGPRGGGGQDGGRAERKIVHPPLLRAAADAVSLKWNLLSCLFLGLTAGDLLQNAPLRLPARVLGRRCAPAVQHGRPGGPAALPGHEGQPDGGGDPAGRQPPADRGQCLSVSVLPAVGHLCAVDRCPPQRGPAGPLRPGGPPTGCDHRGLCQLTSAPPRLPFYP